MPTYLVTGAARGLGLGLVAELASLPALAGSTIFATTRNDNPGSELEALIFSTRDRRIVHVPLDVSSPTSIAAGAAAVALHLAPGSGGSDQGLDYLLNNAAIRDPGTVRKPEDLSASMLSEALTVNVSGLHETIRAFLPLLRKGNKKTVVVLGSTLGSITTAQNDHFSRIIYPAYKISKAGTHMAMALWSNQLKHDGFTVYLQSPGNLQTDLGGAERADLPVQVGAKEVVRIMHEAEIRDSGRNRNIHVKGWEKGGGIGGKYDGEDLPW